LIQDNWNLCYPSFILISKKRISCSKKTKHVFCLCEVKKGRLLHKLIVRDL